VLPLDPSAFMGAAIGFLAPGSRFEVHYHHALEQLTFVLKGRVWVTMLSSARVLESGEAMTNPPGVTLAFANEDSYPAEVLFVCAPPFPADGGEVVVTGKQRELNEGELEVGKARRGWVLEHFRSALAARGTLKSGSG